MQSSLYAAILRLAIISLVCVFSFARALPAIPNTKPSSLLGRSYTRRAGTPSIVLGSPRLASNSQTRQLDGPGPLGRAQRFQIAQRLAVVSPSASEDKNGVQHVEARAILLSHQQAAPPVAGVATSSSPVPAPIPAPAMPTLPAVPQAPQPAPSPAPGARVAKKSKTKSKAETMKHRKMMHYAPRE
ncbi:hypothetical protein C8R43DRAFT_1130420 [Mycena crocata]|nr:hypothetical protein C8R43DRAFT_1130420 [Mycena crocata]